VVTLQLAQPAAAPATLTRDGTVFMTARHGGESEKREVAFGPATDTAIAAGATAVAIPVIARMVGTVTNLGPGEIVVAHGVPEGATVTQAAPTSGGQDPALWFIFIAGFIAISAMVLPGISGSFILLMLGLYHYLTFNLRAVVYDRDGAAMVIVAVFLVALVAGILLFSRFLNWLLARWHDTTMAALVGLMVGSLRKLWPFTATGPDGETANVLPGGFDGVVGVTVATFVVGLAIVVLLERVGRSKGGLAKAE
jgi:putative membrane protein